jgi:hypothetical protein
MKTYTAEELAVTLELTHQAVTLYRETESPKC